MSSIPMELFEAQVTGTERLSRDFVRVQLASEQLSRLAAPAGDGVGERVNDAYIKLFIPHPDLDGPVRLDLNDTWRKEWFAADPRDRGGWIRTYTLRDARPWTSPEGADGVEIDIDFVLHEPEGDHETSMGPGASWAAQAQTGDSLTFIGPSRDGQLWTMWNPEEAGRVLVSADETAVPAALSVLRSLPEGVRATFLLEVPEGNSELVELASPLVDAARKRTEIDLHWLERTPRVQRGQLTLQALRDVLGVESAQDESDSSLGVRVAADEFVWGASDHPGQTYVYLAGEASVVRASRRVCVNEAGIDKASISFMGYWKAGHAES